MFQLDQELTGLMEEVEATGYKIYLVGGFVRDLILKRKTRDLDLATSMPIKDLKDLLASYELKEFNENYGSLKFELKSYEVEITQFRKEGNYQDSRHPEEIEFIDDLQVDVLRRDFTMNALYMDKDGNIYDPTGGIKDIDQKLIRSVKDAKVTFSEDALRLVRLYRFHAQLDFFMEEKTLKTAQKLLPKIQNLKPIQIKSETVKILASPSFESLYDKHEDFLKILLPGANFPKEIFTMDCSWEYKLLYMYTLEDLENLLKSWELSSRKRKYLLSLKSIMQDYSSMALEELFIKHGSFMWFEMMTLFLNLDPKFIYRNKFIKILNKKKTRTLFDLKIKGQDLVELEVPKALRNQILMKLLFAHIWKDLENDKTQLLEEAARYKHDIH